MKNSSILIMVCFFAASNIAQAEDGQVNFKGQIIDTACEVVNNLSNPLEVNLGRVLKSAFAGKGSTAAATSFTLQLTNCPESISSARVKFDGVSAVADNSVLALKDEQGVATGIGVQLTDASQKVLRLYTESASYILQPGAAVNSLDFVARYVATADTVTPGPANAVATFDIIYN